MEGFLAPGFFQIIRSNNEKTHEIQGKNRYNLHKMHDNQTSAKSQTKNNKKNKQMGFFDILPSPRHES